MSNSELIITIAVTAIGSAGFWDFIKWLCSKLRKKKTAQEEALLALLHDRLYELLTQFDKQDHIDPDDYNNLLHLYEAYRELDGNGLIRRMFEQVSKIPVHN